MTQKHILFAACCINSLLALGQQRIDLKEAYEKKEIRIVNRAAVAFSEGERQGIQFDERPGDGLVWITNSAFSKGTIEVDLKGQDVFQKSFLGVAFHGVNDSTYDAVYFRPFNFRTPDSVRHIHAVQYISHPQFTWRRLRDEQNALFEKAILAPPDPNEWFHARIEVQEKEVKVFVNGATTPSLRVTKLNDRTTGAIALWTGDGSGGSFANLVVIPEK